MRASVRSLLIASVAAAATVGAVLPAATVTKPAPHVRDSPWVLHEWIPDGPPLELLVVRQDGTGLHRLMDPSPVPGADIQHGDWSPDGRLVAFEVLRPDGSASVWTVRADGRGARERVVCSAAPCLQIAYPSWSPDGRSLLVVRYDVADNGDWADNWLEVVDLRTGARRAIARVPGDRSFYRPRWSPDASRVVVEIDSYNDATQSELTGSVVAVVDARAGLSSSPVPITPVGMFAANPDWHPYLPLITFGTNDPVTFRSSSDPSNVYTVLPDGRGLRKVTGSVDGALRYGQPTFTPDGQRISLVVARTAGGTRVSTWRPGLVGILGGSVSEIGVSGFWPKVAPPAS